MSVTPDGATTPTTTPTCSRSGHRTTSRATTDSGSLRRCTERTLACAGRDRRQALGAILGGSRFVGRRLVALHQPVDGDDDEEVDDERDEQERHERRDEPAVGEQHAADLEPLLAEVT